MGKSLAVALSHNIENEVQRILHSVVENSEFLRNVVSAVRIRKGMDESSLRAHIAYSAGLSKSQSTMTGTGTVLEVLRRAGVIIEHDGKLVSATPSASAPSSQDNAAADAPSEPMIFPKFIRPNIRSSGVSIQVEVRIDCNPEDLDGLGARLKKLLDDIEGRDVAESEHDPES